MSEGHPRRPSLSAGQILERLNAAADIVPPEQDRPLLLQAHENTLEEFLNNNPRDEIGNIKIREAVRERITTQDNESILTIIRLLDAINKTNRYIKPNPERFEGEGQQLALFEIIKTQGQSLEARANILIKGDLRSPKGVSNDEREMITRIVTNFNTLRDLCTPENLHENRISAHINEMQQIMADTSRLMEQNPSNPKNKFIGLAITALSFICIAAAVASIAFCSPAGIALLIAGVFLCPIGNKFLNSREVDKHELQESTKKTIKEFSAELNKVPNLLAREGQAPEGQIALQNNEPRGINDNKAPPPYRSR